MKHTVIIDATHASAVVTTQFQADTVLILNPTAFTIGMRIGGTDPPPDIPQCDIWCPPANALVYPVSGNTFAFSKILPQLAAQSPSMPNAATILLMANEPLPNLGALALSTVETFITNPQLPVINVPGDVLDINISGQVADLTATIQNARIGIVNASGDTLRTFAQHPNDVILRQMGVLTAVAYPAVITRTNYIDRSYHSLSITAIDPNVSAISIIGQDSGFVYLALDDARVFLKQRHFVVPFFPDIDDTIVVACTIVAATVTAYTLLGHRSMEPRSATSEGFTMVHVNPPRIAMYTGVWYDSIITPPFPLTTFATYAADSNYITTVRAVYISMDGSTTAGDLRFIFEMLELTGTQIVMRFVDMRSQTVFTSQYINVGNIRVPPGFILRAQVANNDSGLAARRVTAFPYIELEKV